MLIEIADVNTQFFVKALDKAHFFMQCRTLDYRYTERYTYNCTHIPVGTRGIPTKLRVGEFLSVMNNLVGFLFCRLIFPCYTYCGRTKDALS